MQITIECDECGSLFYKGVSLMAALCPECAHRLYGYQPCVHIMEAGHCVKCYWDGAQSAYFTQNKGAVS